VESIPIATTALLFAEDAGAGILIERTCGGPSGPPNTCPLGDEGCSSRRTEEGSRYVPWPARPSKGPLAPSLPTSWPTLALLPLPLPPSGRPTVGSCRRLARGVSGRRGPSHPTTWTRLLRPGDDAIGAVWLAACPLRKAEGCRTPGAPRGARGKRKRTPRLGPGRAERSRRARIGRSGSCSRVMNRLQKSSDGVGRREATALHFTRLGGVRGRASSPRFACESTGPRAKGHRPPPRDGNAHVTVEERKRPALGAGTAGGRHP